MTLSDIDVLEPKALGDALNVLRERSDRIKLIAGRTD